MVICGLRQLRWVALWALALGLSPLSAVAADFSAIPRPAKNDHTAASLRNYQAALLAPYGGDYRKLPLAVKAAHFEWEIQNYFTSPWQQVHYKITLRDKVGRPPKMGLGADTSTWNGALLAALSYKYAVTKDRQTLQHISSLLRGLHFFQQVTEYPGLVARSVLQSEEPIHKNQYKYTDDDGTVYHFRSDPAKGTYNQLVGGYATLMLLVYQDLPAADQQLALDDLTAAVVHLLEHDYRLTDKDGKPTPYGDMTPVIGPQGVPFNAQVAYMIVATGMHFVPQDHPRRQKIERAFKRLRSKHHVYYSAPLKSFILPQKIGGSVLVKGMNDRNHVTNAAYVSLMLDLHQSARDQTEMDGTFLFRMGRTMFHSLRRIENEHNSLCNFMWCGLLSHPVVFQKIIQPEEQQRTGAQLNYLLYTGIEQLRRFRLDRFSTPGEVETVDYPVWVDESKPNSGYAWKNNPHSAWRSNGPAINQATCSIDYLYAYWLMRYYRLDELVQARQWHGEVLGK